MKELLCITCPMCCRLRVKWRDGDLLVGGNGCKRGVDFAIAETTRPMRSLTTTVKTTFDRAPVLPVRTEGEIPRGIICAAMKELNSVIVDRPIGCGEIVLENLLGYGCNVIATSNILKEGESHE